MVEGGSLADASWRSTVAACVCTDTLLATRSSQPDASAIDAAGLCAVPFGESRSFGCVTQHSTEEE